MKVAYERLLRKITKENLWLYILKMLMERPMYAYEINKKLKETFGFSTSTVTVYVVLYKMRREGLIQTGEEKTVLGRPVRKYYELTDRGSENFFKGLKLLKDTLRSLE
jgi:PadR family transcriptional regulator PadR